MITLKKINKGLCAGGLMLLALTACTEDSPKTDLSNVAPKPQPIVIDRTAFPKGADVSWLTKMEADNEAVFFNADTIKTECMTLLRDECGVNSIRLRVWVNPADGWCNIDDMIVKARRAQQLGLRVMVDFHFSDTWADPGKQIVPRAWKDLDFNGLKEAVKNHVTEALVKLKNIGVEPEWVQIGNETRSGMMYQGAEAYNDPDNASTYAFYDGTSGHYSNGSRFAELVTTGNDAAKAVFPDIKTIVHIDSGNKWSYYTRIFGNLAANGGKYDLIGISLYPDDIATYKDYINDAIDNINKAFTTYGKETMVVEIGMDCDKAEECNTALSMLMEEGAKADSHLKGIFYWEPEAPAGYNGGYRKGAFDEKGMPTKALKAFCK